VYIAEADEDSSLSDPSALSEDSQQSWSDGDISTTSHDLIPRGAAPQASTSLHLALPAAQRTTQPSVSGKSSDVSLGSISASSDTASGVVVRQPGVRAQEAAVPVAQAPTVESDSEASSSSRSAKEGESDSDSDFDSLSSGSA
jgi:hypothetical protein